MPLRSRLSRRLVDQQPKEQPPDDYNVSNDFNDDWDGSSNNDSSSVWEGFSDSDNPNDADSSNGSNDDSIDLDHSDPHRQVSHDEGVLSALESIVGVFQTVSQKSISNAPSFDTVFPDSIPNHAVVVRKVEGFATWLRADTPSKKRHTAGWFWGQFDGMEVPSDLPSPGPFIRHIIAEPSLNLLFSDGRLDDTLRAKIDSGPAMQVRTAMELMENVEDRCAKLNLICIVMYIYFFVTWDPNWSKRQTGYNRLPRPGSIRSEKLYRKMYSNYTALIDEHHENAASLEYDDFKEKVMAWVQSGSKYVFLAHKLSLGSLVVLQAKLTPAAIQFCGKGNERPNSKGLKLREEVLQRLSRCGLVRKAQHADDMVHTLLCNLTGMRRFGRYPGFDQRHGFSM
ncbi:hypothetical protein HBI48_062300 [Parastagonospora nodorum]|nr:hypothetical protein HBI48_062300 [Parastagonospora nodorum]